MSRHAKTKTKPVEQVMAEEWEDWEITSAMRATVTPAVTPHPTQPGGLPDGWTVRPAAVAASVRQPEQTAGLPESDVMVVERAGGGWTMVMRWLDTSTRTPRTNKWSHAAATLEELYASAHPEEWKRRFFETLLHDYIVAHYDPADEADAAEAALVGLGARVTVFPKALRGL